MPTAKLVKCDRCGADAIVKSTEGQLIPDPKQSGAKVVDVIECPHCGLREQPVTLDKT
jgi:DNA-directed RNA polymerase subunit RPC12/RpoP